MAGEGVGNETFVDHFLIPPSVEPCVRANKCFSHMWTGITLAENNQRQLMVMADCLSRLHGETRARHLSVNRFGGEQDYVMEGNY